VSVWPCVVVPEMVGAAVLTGEPLTMALALDSAALDPELFVAVTVTFTVEATSAATSV